MSFSSPLLASLRRPGAEEGASHSSAPSEEEFLRRRRTPGAAEIPAGSETPLFASTNATVKFGHRPSPLGLQQPYSIAEAGTGTPIGTSATTPSGSRLLGGGSRTPTSTGTNFKARLAAMQAAGTPTAGATTTPTSSITPGLGLARSGQLGWTSTGPLSSSRRGTVASTLLTKQQQQQRGPPPPVSSLEDELLNLKIDLNNNTSNGGDVEKAVWTPAKSGITRSARATKTIAPAVGGEDRTPATPTMTPATKGTLPHFSFYKGTSTMTPPVTSTKGIRTKGKKAVGAGALSVARSPHVPGVADATASKDTVESSIHVPKTAIDEDIVDKDVFDVRKQEKEQIKSKQEEESHEETDQGDGGGLRIHTSGVLDARSLQRRLRSQLPEFGISEWSPPLQGATAALTTKPETATVEKTKTLQELATLRSQAETKLEGAFITQIIGQGEDNEPKLSREELTPVVVGKDDDRLCRGVRSAFRATLPELTLPSATPEAAVLPSTSLFRRPASSVSPLERGTRRGLATGGEKDQYSHVANEIEERLERLKLLRNQAIQVTGSSTTGSTTPSKI